MKFSAREINIEVTPEELALLLAPGECIPAMEGETEDDEKDVHIHANIFMPPEMPDKVNLHMNNESGANQKPVSDSDTKAQEENTSISEAEGREILEILAEGLAHNRNGHLVSMGFGRNKEMQEDFECEDGRRFKVTMRRI